MKTFPEQQQQPCPCPSGRFCGLSYKTVCVIHNAHEAMPDERVYLVCGECGHVYRTAGDLEEAWVTEVGGEHRPVERIHSCPFCVHDFW